MACEDVKFQWCLLATEMEDKIASALLKQLVSLYVTIRGFAFVSSCIELYKQASKKTAEKKALCSTLCLIIVILRIV